MKILLKFASGFILAFLVFFGLTSCYNLGHYVSFYYNGRKITSPVIVRDGDTVREPSINMEKEGYTFIGWVDEKGKPFDFDSTRIYSHTRIFAVYSINQYSVTIDGKTTLYDYGTCVKLETLPDTEDGVFDAYYDELNRRYVASFDVKEDIVLTSHFLDKVRIFFDANGGEVEKDSIECVYSKTIDYLPVPTKEGYEFSCWLYNGKKIDIGSTLDRKDDLTLKAFYVPKGSKYKYYPVGEKGIALFDMIEKEDDVSLPDSIDNKPVIKLCSTLFRNVNLTKLYIPDTVEVIEDGLLSSQNYLREIKMKPLSNTSLKRIFNGITHNNNIKSTLDVSIYSNYKKCGSFFNIDSEYELSIIILSDNIEVSESAFEGIRGIKRVILEEGITSIGAYAFRNSNIEELHVPSTLKTIELKAFEESDISKIYINSLESWIDIDFDLESNPISLRSSLIKDGEEINEISLIGINNIKPYSFEHYSKLEKLSLSGDIDTINMKSFYECTNLSCVEIDGKVRLIDYYAFARCENLKQFSFNILIEEIGDNAFENTSIEEINFSSSLKRIGKFSFAQNMSLTRIVINSDIENIEYKAFYQCNQLDEVLINGNVRRIEAEAFSYCSKLSKFTFKDGLEEIGNGAFSYSAIEEIEFPSTLIKIGEFSFINNSDLVKVIINSNIDEIETKTFYQCNRLNEVLINGDVKSICGEAFYGCSLSSLQLNEGLEKIGFSAFKNTRIKELTIPKSLTEIDEEAFMSCVELVKIIFFSDIDMIKRDVFNGCTSLESVTINGSIKSIESRAFYGCTNLSSFDFKEGLISIMDEAFRNSGLKEVSFPSSLTKLGDRCFKGSSNLETVVISSGIKEVGDLAFENCLSLGSVNILSNSIKWGRNPFRDCIYLSKVFYCGTMEDWINKNIKSSYEYVYYWDTSFVLICQDGRINPMNWEEMN